MKAEKVLANKGLSCVLGIVSAQYFCYNSTSELTDI